MHSGAARSTLVAGLDTDGKLLWTHIPKVPDQGSLSSIVNVDGGYVGFGLTYVGGTLAPLLLRRTTANTTLWQRIHAFGGQTTTWVAGGLIRAGNGGFLNSGQRNQNGQTPLWLHADRHGFVSCPDAGGCTSAATTCDDKNPCTADWCDAVGGCQHAPLSGPSCGAGGYCQVGVCK